MGISGVIVAPQTSDPQNYPLEVLIQYVPRGGQSLVDFPFPEGSFVSILVFVSGVKKFRIS